MAPPELEAAFVEGAPRAASESGLLETLRSWLESARAKWPLAHVDEVAFARRLGGLAADAGLAALQGVETDDLYLACGCLAGDAASLAYLSDLVAVGAPKWAAGTHVDIDDLGQQVLGRLVLPENDSAPRLAGYEGRAPLVAYLKTVTRNLAVSLARSATRRQATPPPSALFTAVGDPEHDAMRVQFRDAFRLAIDEAFRGLDSRQRALIAMHYADGVEVEAIAKVYRVHRVTVSRWLGEAREQVFDATRVRLRAALGLTDSEFTSALRAIRSQLDVSFSTIGEKTAP